MKNTVNINPDKLYTKMAYHKLTGKSRSTIDKEIKSEVINSLKIKGAQLIYIV